MHPPSQRVAVLGTGVMGVQMARRLAEGGFAVTAWNRDRAKAAPLEAFGVTVAERAAEALRGADVAIVMLSTGAVVDEIVFAPDAGGLVAAEALRRGATLVVMSTIPVETARAQAARLAEIGVAYVDAPVSGGEPGARDGTLAILAGGDAGVIEALAPVFAPLGRVTRIGDVGAGQLAKLANQIIVAANLCAVAEALHLVKEGGADPAAFRAAITGGFADSTVLQIHGKRMVARDFAPGGTVEQLVGALEEAKALATALGLNLASLDTAKNAFVDLATHGGARLDVAGILVEVERRSGR